MQAWVCFVHQSTSGCSFNLHGNIMQASSDMLTIRSLAWHACWASGRRLLGKPILGPAMCLRLSFRSTTTLALVQVRPPCLCPFCSFHLHRRQPRPWQHVFPDRLHLSALTELETAYSPSWNTPDLKRLVSSCSHLQKLSLRCTPGLQLSALLQLTELVQLWLTDTTDSSTMASLAQLSGLHQL